ncbi:MAG: hypothetical protein J6Z33_07615 [Lachnospiraceae bacterium]|nr:hypothetical protein [Lachnospiraceae bacterium]
MNKLPEQTELILKLKEAYKNKGLSLNKLIDLMPEDERKLGRSTVQRLFHGEGSENKNYDYNTLILLSNLLLDVDDDDDTLLRYKREVIEMLERENKDLRAQLDHEKVRYHEKLERERKKYEEIVGFRTDRIVKLEEINTDLLRAVNRKDELLRKLIEKCDNCKFHKGEN